MTFFSVEAAMLITLYVLGFKSYTVSDVNPLAGILPNCSAVSGIAKQDFMMSYL